MLWSGKYRTSAPRDPAGLARDAKFLVWRDLSVSGPPSSGTFFLTSAASGPVINPSTGGTVLKYAPVVDLSNKLTVVVGISGSAWVHNSVLISQRSAWSSTGIPFELACSTSPNTNISVRIIGNTGNSYPFTLNSERNIFVITWNGTAEHVYHNGNFLGSTARSGTITNNTTNCTLNGLPDGSAQASNKFLVAGVWPHVIPNARGISENPWLIFGRKPADIYVPTSAGGGGATGTGAPAAQSSTVSGTATRTITGAGTPSAQASTVAGTAEREITGSGAPVSQDATVAGTGSVSAGISGSGVLSAQSATVAGTATRTVTASGTPSAQGATVAGTAEREVTGSGTPSAQSATVVGTGQIGNIVTGSGAPAAQSATVAGTAEREITSSGAVSAQSATVAGTGVRVITGTGSTTAQDATVYGYDVAPQTAHNTGGGGSRKMLLSERKVRDEVDEWLKKKREQEMLARIQREDEELVLILALVA